MQITIDSVNGFHLVPENDSDQAIIKNFDGKIFNSNGLLVENKPEELASLFFYIDSDFKSK